MCKIEENEKNNSRVLIDWIKTLMKHQCMMLKVKVAFSIYEKLILEKQLEWWPLESVHLLVRPSSKSQCSSLCNILIQWKKGFCLFLPCYYLGKVSLEKKKVWNFTLGWGVKTKLGHFHTFFYFFFFHVLNHAKLQRNFFLIWGGGYPFAWKSKFFGHLMF